MRFPAIKNFTIIYYTFLFGLICISIHLSSFLISIASAQFKPPFSSQQDSPETPITGANPGAVKIGDDSIFSFVDADLQTGWLPYFIQQAIIFLGIFSVIMLVVAGLRLFILGSNEEELPKATRMIVFSVIGITLAALSYTIVSTIIALLAN